MATNAQIEANRLNAQMSTGPRSVEGKAVSRFNALKFGAEARSLVIPGEDPVELESLARDYHRHLNPAGPLEDFLVGTLVRADWNRRRYARIEAQVFHVLLAAADNPESPSATSPEASLGAVFQADVLRGKALQSILRQSAAAERGYFRALKELRRMQQRRAEEEMEVSILEETLAQAVPALAPRVPAPSAPSAEASGPAPIGFVPQNSPQAVRQGPQGSTASFPVRR